MTLRTLGLVVLSLAAVLFLALWRAQGPQPIPPDAASTRFSAVRAVDVLRQTVGGQAPHPVGSREHAAVRDRIAGHLRRLGYLVEIKRRFACTPNATCAWIHNIEATLSPPDGRTTVVATAHYDSVPTGPGASDDGTGVAATLESARLLRNEATRNRIVFLIDDGEEVGLLGAEAFVRERPEVGAIVNIEARGTSGQSFLFETSGNNLWLAPLVARALPRPVTTSIFATIYDRLPNDTDLTVFKREGLQGVNFAYIGNVERYHTPGDDLSNVDLRSLQHHGDNALATIRVLANAPFPQASTQDAVWFDIFGWVVVWWPASWSIWLAILSTAMALAGTFRLHAPAAVAMGLGGFVLALVATALAAFGIAWLASYRHAGVTWVAHPGAALCAAWITGMLITCAVAALVRRRVGAGELFAGHALGWNVLAIALSATLPGASYLAIVVGAVMSLCTFTLRRPALRVALSSTVAATLLFPFVLVLYGALGRPSLLIIAVMVGLVATTFTPFVERLSRSASAASLALLAICVVAANMLPAFNPSKPRRLNVSYLDDGTGAYWTASTMTPALKRFGFSAEKVMSPWLAAARPLPAVAAPPLGVPPPTVQVVSDQITSGRRAVRFFIRSARSADRVLLALRSDAAVRTFSINGIAPPSPTRRSRSPFAEGWRRASIRGSSALIDVVYERASPIDLVVADYTHGVPREAAALLSARDASSAVPSDDGDMTVVTRRMTMK